MKRMYIYPNILYLSKDTDTNPYIWNLYNSMSKHFELVQTGKKPSRSLFFDIFKYITRTDYIYFNWIEEIALGKFGIFKFVLYYFLLGMMRIRGVKIIYLLHNKKPHQSNRLSIYLLKNILKNADVLLTHSNEGIAFIKKIDPSLNGFMIDHPFEIIENVQPESKIKDIDILIWGTIKPYKGVLDFLNYLNEKNLLSKYKIRIVGKIPDKEYKEKLFRYSSKNITFEAQSIDSSFLEKLIKRSKMVLFTYKDDTVLSSGALMQTLSYGATVIGPSVGAFKDMSDNDLIHVYKSYDSLIKLVDDVINDNTFIDKKKIQSYISSNTWDKFSDKLKVIIENQN